MGEGEDAYDDLVLDDAFVEGATVREASADERLARRRRIDAAHRRLQAERRAAVRRAGRTRRRLTAAAIAFTVVVVALVVVGVRNDWGGPPPSFAVGDAGWSGFEPRPVAADRPPPAGESGPARTPPEVADDDRHAFMARQPTRDDPVAYDPCRAIRLVVDGRTRPPEGDALLAEAVGTVSGATGLRIVIEGPADEDPSTTRDSYQPDRYGERWAPVLVAWTDPGQLPALAGDVVGLGGSQPVRAADGDHVYVSGVVALDGPDVRLVLAEPGGWAAARAALVHELAHLVGLAHVDDASQVMNPVGGGVTDLGAGDRAGLARLGAGRCHPDL